MTSQTPAPPAPAPEVAAPVSVLGRNVPYTYVVAAVFVAALFLDIIDTTIVNVAIPTIGRELDTEAVEWVALAYTLSLAACIPASGWLGDRFGTKRVFMGALVVFTSFSALCGLAQSFPQLIVFRLLQGVGGGMLVPVGVAMMFRAFPPAQRARAATIVMIPTLAAPALGPVLGGLITTTIGWRWIFLVNVPIGIAACIFGYRHLREHTEPGAGDFDLAGFVLSAGSVAGIVYALSEGPRTGWGQPGVLAALVLGALAAIALVVVELRIPSPMLALRLFGERLFRACTTVMMFSMAGFFGVLFILPLYLQNLRGLDALESGLVTFPQALGVLAATQIAGRIYGSVGPRRLMTVGLLGVGVISVLLAVVVDESTNLWVIRLFMVARGFAMGFPMVSTQAASYARITSADNGRASAIFATSRQVALSLAVAIIASSLSVFTPLVGPPPDVERAMNGYHLAFALCAALSIAAAIVAFVSVHDSDAAETMVRRRRHGATAPESPEVVPDF